MWTDPVIFVITYFVGSNKFPHVLLPLFRTEGMLVVACLEKGGKGKFNIWDRSPLSE